MINICSGRLLSHKEPNEMMPHGSTLEDHILSDRGDNNSNTNIGFYTHKHTHTDVGPGMN